MPSSASVTDATTNCRMVHKVKNASFNLIGLPSFADHPMKKMAAFVAAGAGFG